MGIAEAIAISTMTTAKTFAILPAFADWIRRIVKSPQG
jgi:hypothetical protein